MLGTCGRAAALGLGNPRAEAALAGGVTSAGSSRRHLPLGEGATELNTPGLTTSDLCLVFNGGRSSSLHGQGVTCILPAHSTRHPER